MNSSEFDVLLNASVNAVTFVMDYLQIQFDVGTATFHEFPVVSTSTEDFQFGDLNYRNALCEFIGERVASVSYKSEELLCLGFQKGEISVSLLPEKYNSPEIVILDLADRSISV